MPPTGGEHETPWKRAYPAGVPTTYPYPAVHATRLLEDAANDFPDATAVEYRRYRLSYRKLLDHADRLATALGDADVGPGAEVALLLPNCPQLIIAMFAAWRVGAQVRLLTPDDVPSLAETQPRVLVVIDRWYGRYVARSKSRLGSATSIVVTGIGDYLPFPDNVLLPVWQLLRRRRRVRQTNGVLGFADLVRRNLPAPDEPSDSGRLSALASPLGEAVPLGAVTQHQLVVNSFQLRLWLPDLVAGDERVLLGLPLSSTLGAVWILTSVLAAATMILIDDRRASARQRLAVHARPTLLPIDQELGDHLLRPTRRRSALSSVRIAVSRDALSPQRRRALEELTDKGRIRRAWGVQGLLTHADPIYGRYEEGTVGLPLPDTAVVVADPSRPGHAAPLGCRGRLWLRGPQLRGAEWVDSGIDGSLDAAGYLRVDEGG
jgi:long-chain acyl-CoA synthetase